MNTMPTKMVLPCRDRFYIVPNQKLCYFFCISLTYSYFCREKGKRVI